MRNTRLVGVVFILLSAVGYGSGPLFAKWIYPTGFDWLDLLAWRHMLAAIILSLAVLIVPHGRRALRTIDRSSAFRALAVGALFTANASTYFASLTWIDASLAGLMTYSYPAIVAVLSIFFAHAPSGWRPWAALAIATTGVVLGVGGISAGREPALIGLVLGVASPIIYSCYIILAARMGGESKRGTGAKDGGGLSPLIAVPLGLIGTSLGVFAVRIVLGRVLLPLPIPDLAIIPVLGVATIAGILPIGAFYIGAQRLGAARAAIVSTVEPVYTIIAASIIFGERLTLIQLLGGVLILGAVLVAEWDALLPERAARAKGRRGN
ncbi:MAG: DMT family transporter [Candidatus Limnocylindrus sp.]